MCKATFWKFMKYKRKNSKSQAFFSCSTCSHALKAIYRKRRSEVRLNY